MGSSCDSASRGNPPEADDFFGSDARQAGHAEKTRFQVRGTMNTADAISAIDNTSAPAALPALAARPPTRHRVTIARRPPAAATIRNKSPRSAASKRSRAKRISFRFRRPSSRNRRAHPSTIQQRSNRCNPTRQPGPSVLPIIFAVRRKPRALPRSKIAWRAPPQKCAGGGGVRQTTRTATRTIIRPFSAAGPGEATPGKVQASTKNSFPTGTAANHTSSSR